MSRAVVKYVFATLLVLLSTQSVVPSARVVSAVAIVCCAKAEQQASQETRCVRLYRRVLKSAPAYQSWTGTESNSPVLFQRPPPAPSLFA